jgi:hypothetical protein
MKFTTEQTDIICTISIVLKKIPYCYSEDSAEWFVQVMKNECVGVDFEKKEIQLMNWNYLDDTIYLQLLGICKMYNLELEEYQRK